MNLPKAFDTINCELLIAKLCDYGFSKDVLKLIISYVADFWKKKETNKRLVLDLPLCMKYHRDLFWDLFYFLFCDVCNFEDDTTPYVCDKNLSFVISKVEEHSNIAMKCKQI